MYWSGVSRETGPKEYVCIYVHTHTHTHTCQPAELKFQFKSKGRKKPMPQLKAVSRGSLSDSTGESAFLFYSGHQLIG